MKLTLRISLLAVFLLALAFPGVALARDLAKDVVVFGNSYVLKSGETLVGNLIVFGGTARVEEGAALQGDLVLFGGSLEVAGRVEGSVAGVGGQIHLANTALVAQDIATVGVTVNQDDGAQVLGEFVTGVQGPVYRLIPNSTYSPGMNVSFSPVVNGVWFVLKLFLWAALAALTVLFLPKPVERIQAAAVSQPMVSGGLGLLTVVILPPILLGLILTVCLIPLSLAAVGVFVVAWFLGMVSLSLEVGRRLERQFKQDWAPALTAGIGAFVLFLVINGLREVVPCIGWVFPALAGVLAVGAALLTRIGTQDYRGAELAAAVETEEPAI
ncbi:MAG: polymer-forming cytoskeletal protein [Chloroflexi bacterium]|nr:polymer-forming cytoskeletal protein [Chloroflexota bacterium]